jgi:transitional endoplasmic reticulum ATPase
MVRHRRSSHHRSIHDIPDLVRLWLLRLLVPLNAQQEFIRDHGFANDIAAEAIGLGEWVFASSREFDPRQARAALRKLYEDAERQLAHSRAPADLTQNLTRLAGLVGLSPIDCRIVEFAVLIHSERLLDDAADWLGSLSSVKVYHALSILLDLPEADIRAALSAHGLLARSGLVKVDHHQMGVLRAKLELLSSHFANRMLSTELDPLALLRDTVTPSAPPNLTIEDFDHLAPSLNLLRPYLQQAAHHHRRGVNVFLYGPPGTGKTQLTRVIAQELGCQLFEIASEDEDGDPVDGEHRLRAFRAAQSFFAQRDVLILFDEVEDVFNDGNSLFGRKSTAQTRKAWINRMLEDNPVPALWLSNSIACLDPAFVRRFDMIIELEVPPRKQRERILRRICGDLLPADSIARIVAAESLAPAVIARAASVVNTIRESLPANEVPRAVERLIGNTVEAQGHEPLKLSGASVLPDFYDPAFINATVDLAAIAEGLAQSKSGRLCLYGPPGTGKTAFGRWLAGHLGMPLHVKRASDLLSMWVGGTEKNIARAFLEAEQEAALLLLDEVDGFLQDRRGARAPWEVTGVNEMLTQMESFPGVFIASTNLMKGLDQAAFRRFDLKIEFDYLKPEQSQALFQKYCAALGIEGDLDAVQSRLAKLSVLTPGDFAAVARQHRFRPLPTPTAFVVGLEEECALKAEERKAAIGFI